MSEVVVVSAGPPVVQATIYGSHDGGKVYIGSMLGATYATWLSLDAPTQKQSLISARRRLDQLEYVEGYTTFALRDAYDLGTGDADAAFPWRAAEYELAVLGVDDPDVFAVEDQGSNIQRVYAGGAGVDFFVPTSSSRGSASLLPPIIMRLIGQYLAISTADIGAEGGTGETGSCVNPFGPCRDFDRKGPW